MLAPQMWKSNSCVT